MQRVLTAAVGAPLALAALFYLPRLGFLAVVLGVCLIAAHEFSKLGLAGGSGRVLWILPGFVGLAVVLLAEPALVGAVETSERNLALALLVVLGSPLAALWSAGSARERALGACALAFGTLYLSVPVFAFDQLRSRDPWLVVLLLAVVWLTDTGAFFVGGRWGKRKLAAKTSPNKTWEGAIGGLLLGVVVAGVWSQWRLGSVEPGLLVVGAVVSSAGQIGDLIESLAKRAVGVKDSGTLLPGHGGMLDRLDSLLIAAPVLELLCRLTGFASPSA